MTSLLDDLNTPLAIKIIHDYAKQVFITHSQGQKQLYASYVWICANFLGLMSIDSQQWFHSAEDEKHINDLINKRLEAKKQKDWSLADQIRQQLMEKNIVLEDKPNDTTIWRKNK